MYNNYHNRNEERKEEKPPYSRIFVVCNKQTNEVDLRDAFAKYGFIEDLYIPRDRSTGESKGIAYIKYTKTTAAAAAIQDLHLKSLKAHQKPIKVMIASYKNDSSSINEERYKRLFIKVHREVEEKEIVDHFSKFGRVDSVHIQMDRITGICKGFAYVHYTNFFDAAKAYEDCDKKYKPVFATPKDELKRGRHCLESSGFYSEGSPNHSRNNNDQYNPHFNDTQWKDSLILQPKSTTALFKTIVVTCSPQVPHIHIKRLFDIIPGMLQSQYSVDTYNGYCESIISYDNEKAAVYAYEKLNNYEFPSGEIITIKPDDNPLNKVANNLVEIVNSFKHSLDAGNPNLVQLADAIAQTSSLIKAATSGKMDQNVCNTDNGYGMQLPPTQPIANSDSRVAKRCFIVCKPHPPPLPVLRDIFCRFGDLIDVCTFPNKNFGFVKYASIKAAQDAIQTLHGTVLCGINFKVLEADERPSKEDDHKVNESSDDCSDHIKESKRIKLHNNDMN